MNGPWLELVIVAAIVVGAAVGLVLALRRDPCSGCALKSGCSSSKLRRKSKKGCTGTGAGS